MIKFDVTKEDREIIENIVSRGFCKQIYKDRIDMYMDVTATHQNGCPLKLKELLAADDFNFFHDIYGIYNHLDRKTGELKNCFLPRFAKPDCHAA